jgi:hypothetical protein
MGRRSRRRVSGPPCGPRSLRSAANPRMAAVVKAQGILDRGAWAGIISRMICAISFLVPCAVPGESGGPWHEWM